MGVGRKFSLGLLLFVTVFATVSLALSERDPEVGVCKLKCEQIRGAEQDEKLKCKQSCERYQQDKQKREREAEQGKGKGGSGGGRSGGGGDIIFAEEERELQQRVGECLQSCQGRKEGQPSPECFRTCMQKYRPEEEKGRGGGGDTSPQKKGRKGDRDTSRKQQSNNPYVFEDHHFTARLETEQGSIRVLQKFTDRSDLFQGIEKYRVAFLEAEPQTFVVPNHWDADALFFVANGEGTISLINTESRRSFNLKRGDIFRVPAGINAYLINRHNKEKLVLAKILRSVSVPGELQTFFGIGAENPKSSFLNAFSIEVLEAAFDADEDSLKPLLGQLKQEEGIFKKATEEQIRSLTGEDAGRTWPFGERKGPYNIYNKNPSVQNDHGNLHEVDSNDFSDLREINVAFSFFNITQGSIAGPFYNTKATTVLVVPNGEGRFEMACPHLSEQSGSGGSTPVPTYENVNSPLRRGTVAVIPAGHPLVIEASGNQNLGVIGFGLNSDENEWFPIAGRDNVMSQWEDEAIELTIGRPASEVKKVVQKQSERLFFEGPKRSGRAYA